ncbi:hypothetical protein NSTC745_04568 [Nostoc sp. DSM 114161]|jgi:hypothetical protein
MSKLSVCLAFTLSLCPKLWFYYYIQYRVSLTQLNMSAIALLKK